MSIVNIDHFKNLRTIALAEVTSGESIDYQIRRILRWYSRTFNVTLEQAARVPLDVALVHFYESTYEAMDDSELEAERLELLHEEGVVSKERQADLEYERRLATEVAASESAPSIPPAPEFKVEPGVSLVFEEEEPP